MASTIEAYVHRIGTVCFIGSRAVLNVILQVEPAVQGSKELP